MLLNAAHRIIKRIKFMQKIYLDDYSDSKFTNSILNNKYIDL
jgi:hypothetical protein